MATITERPHGYCYSKNDVRYVLTVADATLPGLFVQVKIMFAKMGAGAFTELYTFEGLKPNADGSVYVYIQSYINSVLNYVLPTINASATDAGDQVCRFYIQFREVTDADPDPAWVTTESTSERIAIKGGIEQHKASRNNIFVNYIDTQKPFLTWQPAGRFVFSDEPVYLSFLNRSLAGFKIKVSMKAIDGATLDHLFDHTADNKIIYHLLVSSAFLGLEALLTKKLFYYDVSVVGTDGTTIIVNAMRFYIEYRPVYQFYDLVYHNSLTGIDSVRVCGDTATSYARATVESETGMNINEWNAAAKSHEKYFSNITIQRNYKGNVGSLKTRSKQQQESFIELLISKSIYMRFENWWVPVVNVQAGVDLGNRKNTTDGFAVEWQLSESNEVFTPAGKVFGLGA
jgi:hypothetical protein